MTSQRRASGSIDKVLLAGGKMLEYHEHSNDENFTAKVKTNDGKIMTFTNIQPDHMEQLRKGHPDASRGVTRQSGSIQQALADGGVITMIHQHENNPQLTVHVRLSDEETEMAFTNVSPQSLEELETQYDNVKEALKEVFKEDKKGGLKLPKGQSFIELVENQGGKITDYHPTERGTYSVYVQTKDGSRHPFSSISEEHMQQYAENFESGGTRRSEE
ncbi:hypothetical protein HDV05_006032 [Chytridiales sp. JEL 0842]|nr:hypothetical protein HDV05_006032 [Chytridiales sp. JEL 0842]